MEGPSLCFWALLCFAIILARYFVLAGLSYWWLYLRSPSNLAGQGGDGAPPGLPSARSILQDIRLSVLSAAIFAVAAALVLNLQDLGLTRLYHATAEYGLWYLGASYLLVLILQDSFFYASHRLCHHPALYSWMHLGHHRSGQPTPWTSFAFDPPEALLHALFLVGIVMLLPLHLITLLAVLTTMTVWAIVNHLGLERLPVCFPHHWLGRWFIGPAHHSLHHRRGDRHFGLYFTFWDWILATEDPGYGQGLQPTLDWRKDHPPSP